MYNDMNPVITYYMNMIDYIFYMTNLTKIDYIYWFIKSSVFLVFFLGPSLPPKRIWGRLGASYIWFLSAVIQHSYRMLRKKMAHLARRFAIEKDYFPYL
jgi:hypothetical protein